MYRPVIQSEYLHSKYHLPVIHTAEPSKVLARLRERKRAADKRRLDRTKEKVFISGDEEDEEELEDQRRRQATADGVVIDRVDSEEELVGAGRGTPRPPCSGGSAVWTSG